MTRFLIIAIPFLLTLTACQKDSSNNPAPVGFPPPSGLSVVASTQSSPTTAELQFNFEPGESHVIDFVLFNGKSFSGNYRIDGNTLKFRDLHGPGNPISGQNKVEIFFTDRSKLEAQIYLDFEGPRIRETAFDLDFLKVKFDEKIQSIRQVSLSYADTDIDIPQPGLESESDEIIIDLSQTYIPGNGPFKIEFKGVTDTIGNSSSPSKTANMYGLSSSQIIPSTSHLPGNFLEIELGQPLPLETTPEIIIDQASVDHEKLEIETNRRILRFPVKFDGDNLPYTLKLVLSYTEGEGTQELRADVSLNRSVPTLRGFQLNSDQALPMTFSQPIKKIYGIWFDGQSIDLSRIKLDSDDERSWILDLKGIASINSAVSNEISIEIEDYFENRGLATQYLYATDDNEKPRIINIEQTGVHSFQIKVNEPIIFTLEHLRINNHPVGTQYLQRVDYLVYEVFSYELQKVLKDGENTIELEIQDLSKNFARSEHKASFDRQAPQVNSKSIKQISNSRIAFDIVCEEDVSITLTAPLLSSEDRDKFELSSCGCDNNALVCTVPEDFPEMEELVSIVALDQVGNRDSFSSKLIWDTIPIEFSEVSLVHKTGATISFSEPIGSVEAVTIGEFEIPQDSILIVDESLEINTSIPDGKSLIQIKGLTDLSENPENKQTIELELTQSVDESAPFLIRDPVVIHTGEIFAFFSKPIRGFNHESIELNGEVLSQDEVEVLDNGASSSIVRIQLTSSAKLIEGDFQDIRLTVRDQDGRSNSVDFELKIRKAAFEVIRIFAYRTDRRVIALSYNLRVQSDEARIKLLVGDRTFEPLTLVRDRELIFAEPVVDYLRDGAELQIYGMKDQFGGKLDDLSIKFQCNNRCQILDVQPIHAN